MWLTKQIGDFELDGFSHTHLKQKIGDTLRKYGKPGGLLPDGDRHELAAYRFLGSSTASIRMMLRTYKVNDHRELVISFVEFKAGVEEEWPTLYGVRELIENGKLEDIPSVRFEEFVTRMNECGKYHALFSEKDLQQIIGCYW